MTERMVVAVANPHVDILGHCTGRLIGKRPESTFDADYVFAACAQFGTAVEINCRPERLDPPRRAARAGRRVRLLVLDRHRRPRHRPAGVAAPRLRPGRRARRADRAGRSTRWAPTSSWPGRRVADAAPGPLVGDGRAADVYDVGKGRSCVATAVARAPGHVEREVAVMRHLAVHGYPVPPVHEVDGADLVMDRLDRHHDAERAGRPGSWRMLRPNSWSASHLQLATVTGRSTLVERGVPARFGANPMRSSTSTSIPTTSCSRGRSRGVRLDERRPRPGRRRRRPDVDRQRRRRRHRRDPGLIRFCRRQAFRNRFVSTATSIGVAEKVAAALLPEVGAARILDPNVRPEEADRIRALIASHPT